MPGRHRPRTSAPRRLSRAAHERLIGRLSQADRTPIELAEELGLSLDQLAAWAADPGNTAVLERLARLADIRTQLLVSLFRANAAAQLIQIATAREHSELSRKACVDLLAADLQVFPPPASDGDAARPNLVIDEATALRALEQLANMETQL